MIRSFVTLAALLLLHASLGAEPRRVAFERGSDVWVANLDGTGAKKIARGSQPDISPDGARVAFNTDSGGSKELDRRIAFADVVTGKATVFKKEIPSDNCQHAVWSPDGSQILFNLYTENDWHLGLINADGSGFRYVKKASSKNSGLWSACWAPDGHSVYVQDLDKISQLDLDGVELTKRDLHALFPSAGLTSSSRMAVSPDGNTLLLEAEMDEEVEREDWDGPPPGIWTLDLAAGTVTRLTPKGFFGWSPLWLSGEEILFVSQGAKEKQRSLYRMSRQGENRKQVFKNVDAPSVSR
jgi:TolB protein